MNRACVPGRMVVPELAAPAARFASHGVVARGPRHAPRPAHNDPRTPACAGGGSDAPVIPACDAAARIPRAAAAGGARDPRRRAELPSGKEEPPPRPAGGERRRPMLDWGIFDHLARPLRRGRARRRVRPASSSRANAVRRDHPQAARPPPADDAGGVVHPTPADAGGRAGAIRPCMRGGGEQVLEPPAAGALQPPAVFFFCSMVHVSASVMLMLGMLAVIRYG